MKQFSTPHAGHCTCEKCRPVPDQPDELPVIVAARKEILDWWEEQERLRAIHQNHPGHIFSRGKELDAARAAEKQWSDSYHSPIHEMMPKAIALIKSLSAPKRESVEQVMGEGSRLRMENSPKCLSGTPTKIIREALEAAPVYVTKDGTWLNFRPDADRQKGGAMIKVEGNESEAIKAFGEKVEAALTALSKIEGGES